MKFLHPSVPWSPAHSPMQGELFWFPHTETSVCCLGKKHRSKPWACPQGSHWVPAEPKGAAFGPKPPRWLGPALGTEGRGRRLLILAPQCRICGEGAAAGERAVLLARSCQHRGAQAAPVTQRARGKGSGSHFLQRYLFSH